MVTHSYTVVDTAPPTVTITTPAEGAEFEINSDGAWRTSGVRIRAGRGSTGDGCVGTGGDGDPIDTGTLGAKSFTVTGTDVAGNETDGDPLVHGGRYR